MIRKLFAVLLLAAVLPAVAMTDEEIRKALAERVDGKKQVVGIVVGVVDESGRRVIAYGLTAKGGSRAVDGDTLFEIGSITKVFTARILAGAVARGVVKLDDPVSKFLPESVKLDIRFTQQDRLRRPRSDRVVSMVSGAGLGRETLLEALC